ncbi:MAG: nicotinamide-nucleotide amidohydrolase family protein [Clostridia bacterium]|nr:nicotinamide-nucleotide amidohydrolase family protein [Clostridia bacterium]
MDNLKQKAKIVYECLKTKNKILATAESCTGGMIGEMITSVPGSSEVYEYGFITYSNTAKQKLLGVSAETLSIFGAVSAETVCEMADGALKASDADIAVSVSGIAGPGGGSEQKPVGLVYVGIAQKGEKTEFFKLMLSGDRDSVRQKTVDKVFDLIIEIYS